MGVLKSFLPIMMDLFSREDWLTALIIFWLILVATSHAYISLVLERYTYSDGCVILFMIYPQKQLINQAPFFIINSTSFIEVKWAFHRLNQASLIYFQCQNFAWIVISSTLSLLKSPSRWAAHDEWILPKCISVSTNILTSGFSPLTCRK